MSGGFFIAGGAVDLARQIKARDLLDRQGGGKFARIDIVIFDGIAGPAHHGFFQPGNGGDQGELDILGQGGRDAVGIDRIVVKSFWLKENLVTFSVREAGDLVFDRRAIARSDAADLAGIHRRAMQIGANDGVGGQGGAGDAAAICGVVIFSVRKEKGTGGSSPGCISSAAQSMVRPSRRGGVPVLSRPICKPKP